MLAEVGKVVLPEPANGKVAQEVGLHELAAERDLALHRLATAEIVVLTGPAAGR